MFVGFSIFDSVSCLLKFTFLCNKIHPHGNCVYILYTKIVQDVYNRCIQNVYKIKKTMPAQFCIQNVYKSLSKCEIHFVYILYKKFCRNVGYILYTVKPVYNGHLGDKVSVVIIDRWSL